MNVSQGIDSHYRRNTLGLSASEALWGFGLPVLVESTFLQVFLKNLGASDSVIGLLPGLLSAGVGVFALLAALLTSHLRHKRRAVIITHVMASIPILLYGIALLLSGEAPGTVTLFLVFYSMFALMIGITLPVWQNFIVSIFSEKRVFRALSVMLITQIFCRFLGGLAIARFVETYSLSMISVGFCFITVGLLLFAGSFFFMIIREDHGDDWAPVSAHSPASLVLTIRDILHHRDFMLFQLGNIDIYACVTVITFYANYAVLFHGVDRAAAAGLFIAFIQGGAIASNVVLGWFNLLAIRSKYYFAKMCGLSAVILLVTVPCQPVFFLASLLIGLARGAQTIAYSPAVKMISGRKDATDYFSVTPLIMLPFSFGIPFSGGMFLEHSGFFGGSGYQALFAAMGVLIIISAFFIGRTRFDGKGREGYPHLGAEINPLE